MSSQNKNQRIITSIELEARNELVAPFQACILEVCKKRNPPIENSEIVSDLSTMVFNSLIENHEDSGYILLVKIKIFEADGYFYISFQNQSTSIFISSNFFAKQGEKLKNNLEKKGKKLLALIEKDYNRCSLL